MTGQIRIEQTEQVATVWIDNPTKKNAIARAMWIALGEAFAGFAQQGGLRCIVLRGAGEDAFGSGADIAEFSTTRADRAQATEFARHVHGAMRLVRDCPVPTLAAVCDLRICTEDSRFAVPIARLGATLAYAELQGLQDLAGPSVALELLLEGRTFGAAEALAKGLVGRVLPRAEFEAETAATVARICAGAPLSARWHKQFVRRLRDPAPLAPEEIAEGLACFDTEDYRIGYRSFLAKSAPKFIGR